MTKQHKIGYYKDGQVSVAFCKVCSAEGEKLFEECSEKIIHTNDKNTLDETNKPAK